MGKKITGNVVYILTNDSFPDYIKIGYASSLKDRLDRLNKSESIPFPFHVYAVYEVNTSIDSDKSNKKEDEKDFALHKIIDKLNSALRSVGEYDGKKRVREFFKMSAEDAYCLLESIARLSGTTERLHFMKPEGNETLDEESAKEKSTKIKGIKEKRHRISFDKCGISVGAELTLLNHPEYVAKVLPNGIIECDGKKGSISSLAKDLLGINYQISGSLYWTYNDERLVDLRERLEKEGKYK